MMQLEERRKDGLMSFTQSSGQLSLSLSRLTVLLIGIIFSSTQNICAQPNKGQTLANCQNLIIYHQTLKSGDCASDQDATKKLTAIKSVGEDFGMITPCFVRFENRLASDNQSSFCAPGSNDSNLEITSDLQNELMALDLAINGRFLSGIEKIMGLNKNRSGRTLFMEEDAEAIYIALSESAGADSIARLWRLKIDKTSSIKIVNLHDIILERVRMFWNMQRVPSVCYSIATQEKNAKDYLFSYEEEKRFAVDKVLDANSPQVYCSSVPSKPGQIVIENKWNRWELRKNETSIVFSSNISASETTFDRYSYPGIAAAPLVVGPLSILSGALMIGLNGHCYSEPHYNCAGRFHDSRAISAGLIVGGGLTLASGAVVLVLRELGFDARKNKASPEKKGAQ